MAGDEEALHEMQRISDQELRNRDKFKNWVIILLIALCSALGGSGLTVWAVSPIVRSNTQGVMTNNMRAEALVLSLNKLETFMRESSEKQTAIVIAITRLEEAIK